MDFEEEIDLEAILDDKFLVDKDRFKIWVANFIEADARLRERLFIVQVAVEDGWSVAKGVALRKTAKHKDDDYGKEIEMRRK